MSECLSRCLSAMQRTPLAKLRPAVSIKCVGLISRGRRKRIGAKAADTSADIQTDTHLKSIE
jgi:hypothetical protein